MSTEIPGEWATDPDRNCAHRHPDDYFPDTRRFEHAALLCAGCPVQTACLKYAVDRPELVGVWGGTTERQRAWLRRRAVA